MKSDRRVTMIVAALLTLSLIMAGCGKKADPFPPRLKPVAAILALNVATGGEGIVIRVPSNDEHKRSSL
jgi:hypothetical protein